MKRVLRPVILTALVALVLVMLPLARAQAATNMDLSARPWSVGLQVGFLLIANDAVGARGAFSMEIPAEYTFHAGPGELALHMGFLLNTGKGFTAIGIPLGARYKMRIMKNHPLYAWPLIDLGPSFGVGGGLKDTISGFIRFGGGVSYLVHPNVELMAMPAILGASFGVNMPAAFLYNFLLGANFRF